MIFEVLLPYGFLLEYNGLRGSITLGGVLLSYVFAGIHHFKLLNLFSVHCPVIIM